jgi:FkbM family methyltransferase
VTQLFERLGRHRWLHELVALSHIYPVAELILRRFPLRRRLKPSGLIYRVTSLDQFSIEYGMFKLEEYASALEDHPVATFIDLGCNAGWFALWLTARSRDPRSKGLLVDAHPRMVAEATWHMKRNGLDNCAVVHGAVGVDPAESSITFHIHPSSVASSLLPYQPGTQHPSKGRITDVTVPTISVGTEWNRWFGDVQVDLLKVDIEGKELDFIVYEGRFIQQQVSRLILEWHKWSTSLADLDDQLTSIGFRRFGVYGETDTIGVATYRNLDRR